MRCRGRRRLQAMFSPAGNAETSCHDRRRSMRRRLRLAGVWRSGEWAPTLITESGFFLDGATLAAPLMISPATARYVAENELAKLAAMEPLETEEGAALSIGGWLTRRPHEVHLHDIVLSRNMPILSFDELTPPSRPQRVPLMTRGPSCSRCGGYTTMTGFFLPPHPRFCSPTGETAFHGQDALGATVLQVSGFLKHELGWFVTGGGASPVQGGHAGRRRLRWPRRCRVYRVRAALPSRPPRPIWMLKG